jgi:hypothetical protein
MHDIYIYIYIYIYNTYFYHASPTCNGIYHTIFRKNLKYSLLKTMCCYKAWFSEVTELFMNNAIVIVVFIIFICKRCI